MSVQPKNNFFNPLSDQEALVTELAFILENENNILFLINFALNLKKSFNNSGLFKYLFETATADQQRIFLSSISENLIEDALEAFPEDGKQLILSRKDITSDHIEKVFNKTGSLEVLELRCPLIEDRSFTVLFSKCNALKECFIHNPLITDKSIETLAENTPNLKRLEVDTCVKLTNRSLIAYKIHCEGSSFSHSGCPLITDDVEIPLLTKWVWKKKFFDQNFEGSISITFVAVSLALRNEATGPLLQISGRTVANVAIAISFLICIVEVVVRPLIGLVYLPFDGEKSKLFFISTLFHIASIPTFFLLFAKNVYKEQISDNDLMPIF